VFGVDSFASELIGPRLDRRRLLASCVVPAVSLIVVATAGDVDARKREKDKKKKKSKHRQKSSGSAQDVVKEAQKYKGSRYKMGGESPKGFDCSGFTWYVYQKATGMDIGRTVDDQWGHGHSVSKGSIDPGDIVFFKNTFEKGLSHCGISLGGNKFIHAENEDTGVVISELDSDYYSQHYAGARRLL
jgi:cell wall-associated NlpC family hydrolase